MTRPSLRMVALAVTVTVAAASCSSDPTVDEIVLLTEDEIARAMRFLFEEHRLVTEGSAALSVAALSRQLVSHMIYRIPTVLVLFPHSSNC